MIGALLWVYATGGFWQPGVGHRESFQYPDVAECDLARPMREQEAIGRGWTGVFTICRPVEEHDT